MNHNQTFFYKFIINITSSKQLNNKMSTKPTRKRKTKSTTTSSPPKINNIENKLIIKDSPNKETNLTKLSKKFFNKTSYDLAKALIGKVLVHEFDGILVKCIIVETELYPGGDDKGSVSYNNRRTPANEPVYGPPGTTWVYLTYGMHHCINISSKDHGGAVLLRAGEALYGHDKLLELRTRNLKVVKNIKPKSVLNGPANLCKAMGIDKKTCNAINVGESDKLWLEEYPAGYIGKQKLVSAKRIGIDRAGVVAVKQLWRFYILGNECVSKREAEREDEAEEFLS